MKTLLKLESVVKKFEGKTVVNGVDLDVAEGQVFVLLGPSGCGKSTTLRCINGLETIDSGNMVFDGVSYGGAGTNWRHLRQQIGMVFQSYELFPHMNVMENLLLAPTKVQKRSKNEVTEEAIALLQEIDVACVFLTVKHERQLPLSA